MQPFVNNRQARQATSSSTTTSNNPNLTPSRSLAASPSPRATGPTTVKVTNATTTTTSYTPPNDPTFSPFSLPGRVSSTRSGDSFDSYDTHDTHGSRHTEGSGYTNGTGYTSDDPRPPDLGAFNTVLREWGYLFGPTARPAQQQDDDQYTAETGSSSHNGPSQRQTIASTSGVAIPRPRRHLDAASFFSGETNTGRHSTVWNQQPIADYLRAISVSGDIDLSDVELIAPALLGQVQRGSGGRGGGPGGIRRIQEENPAAEDTDTEGAQSVVIEHLVDDNSQRGSQESRRGDFTPSVASISVAGSPEERKAADYMASFATTSHSSAIPFPAIASSNPIPFPSYQMSPQRDSPFSPSPDTVPVPIRNPRAAEQYPRDTEEERFFDVPEDRHGYDEDDLDALELDIMDLNAASRIASGIASGAISNVHTHGANTPGHGYGYHGGASTSGTLSASRSIINLNLASTAPAPVKKTNPHAHLYPTVHDSDQSDQDQDDDDEDARSFDHPSHSQSRDPRYRVLAQDIEREYDSYHEQEEQDDQEYTISTLSPTSTIEGPSLGYLDEALNFIAAERARLDAQRAQAAARSEEGMRFGRHERGLGGRTRDVFDYHSPEGQEDGEGDGTGTGTGEDGIEREGEGGGGSGGEGELGGSGVAISSAPKKKRKRRRTRKKSEPQGVVKQGLELEEEFDRGRGAEDDVEQGDDESDPFTSNMLAVTKGKQKKGGLIVLPPAITASASTSTLTGREKKSKSVPATPGPAALKQTFLVPAGDDTTSGYGSPRRTPGHHLLPSHPTSIKRENPASYLSSPYLASAYLSAGTTTTTTTAPNTTDSNSGSANSPEKKKAKRKRSRAGRSGRSRGVVTAGDGEVDGDGDADEKQEEEQGETRILHHARSTPTLRRDAQLPREVEEQMQVEDVKLITLNVKESLLEIPSANEKEADVEELTEAMKLRRKVEQIREKGLEKIRLAEEKKKATEGVEGTPGKEEKKKKKKKEKAEVKVDDASAKLMELTVALAKRFGGEKEDLIGVYRKLRKEGAARYKEFESRGPGMGMGMLGSEEEEDWQEEDPDPRGRDPKRGERLVHVFIDHSNILIGFLNYVKKHPHIYTAHKQHAGQHSHYQQHVLSHSALYNNPAHSLLVPASVSLSTSTTIASSTLINPAETTALSRPLPPIPLKSKPRPSASSTTSKDADTTPPSTAISLPQALLARHQNQMAVAATTNTPIALPSFATAAKRLTLDTSTTTASGSKGGKGGKKAALAPPPSAISAVPNEKLIEFEGAGAVNSAPWSTNRSTSDDVLVFGGANEDAVEAPVKPSDEVDEDGFELVQGQMPRKKKQLKWLWHAALALILERGRPVTRRVCVASSPLHQPMYTLERLDYEVRVYLRVPDLGDGMDRQAKRNTTGTPRKSAANLNSYHTHRASGSTSADGSYGAAYTSSSGNEASGTKAVAIRSVQKVGTSSDTSLLLASSAPASTSIPSPRNQLQHYANASTHQVSHQQPISNGAGAGRVKYREQGVDELLQLKLHQAIAATDDVPEGSTIVLATGDGNVGQFNEDGFLGPVRTALRRGWKVELYAWEEGLSRAWRKEFGPGSEWERNGRFRIIGMEQFAIWLFKERGVISH